MSRKSESEFGVGLYQRAAMPPMAHALGRVPAAPARPAIVPVALGRVPTAPAPAMALGRVPTPPKPIVMVPGPMGIPIPKVIPTASPTASLVHKTPFTAPAAPIVKKAAEGAAAAVAASTIVKTNSDIPASMPPAGGGGGGGWGFPSGGPSPDPASPPPQQDDQDGPPPSASAPATTMAIPSAIAPVAKADKGFWTKLLELFGFGKKDAAAAVHGEDGLQGMAESVVRRARNGDQNAMALIALVRRNAMSGNPRAQASYAVMQNYVNQNPVGNPRISGDSAIVSTNDKTPTVKSILLFPVNLLKALWTKLKAILPGFHGECKGCSDNRIAVRHVSSRFAGEYNPRISPLALQFGEMTAWELGE